MCGSKFHTLRLLPRPLSDAPRKERVDDFKPRRKETVKRLILFMILLIGVFSSGSDRAFAEGLIINQGSTLTLNDAVLDLNCTDLTVANGGTLDAGNGTIDECEVLIINSGAEVLWGTGTINYCQSDAGTAYIIPDPDSLNAPWTLEGPGSSSFVGNGAYTLSSLAQGDYTLEWLDITGWVPPSPNPVTQYLAADDMITFSGTYVMRDSDNDGLSDLWEEDNGLDPNDADSDDDGIPDGVEDANQDGFMDPGETDPCLVDSDGDGIQDGTELGVTTGHPTDTGATFIPDADGGATTTDPLDPDSDDDGFSDGREDRNHNGRVDPGESDPNDAISKPVRPMPWIPLLLLDE